MLRPKHASWEVPVLATSALKAPVSTMCGVPWRSSSPTSATTAPSSACVPPRRWHGCGTRSVRTSSTRSVHDARVAEAGRARGRRPRGPPVPHHRGPPVVGAHRARPLTSGYAQLRRRVATSRAATSATRRPIADDHRPANSCEDHRQPLVPQGRRARPTDPRRRTDAAVGPSGEPGPTRSRLRLPCIPTRQPSVASASEPPGGLQHLQVARRRLRRAFARRAVAVPGLWKQRPRPVFALVLHEQGRLTPALRIIECSPRLGEAYRAAMSTWFFYRTSDYDLRAHKGNLQLDLQAIDLPDGCLDVMLCAHVLEHVPDTDKALAELHRVMAPGVIYSCRCPSSRDARPRRPSPSSMGTTRRCSGASASTSPLGCATRDSRPSCFARRSWRRRHGGRGPWSRWSPEFDVPDMLAEAIADDLVVVADAAMSSRLGFDPATCTSPGTAWHGNRARCGHQRPQRRAEWSPCAYLPPRAHPRFSYQIDAREVAVLTGCGGSAVCQCRVDGLRLGLCQVHRSGAAGKSCCSWTRKCSASRSSKASRR